MPCRFEAVEIFPVEVPPGTLSIGFVNAAHIGAFVPFKPQPAKVLEQIGKETLFMTGFIRVLDTQDEPAPRLARSQKAQECRAGIAEVQLTGGTGSKAGDGGRSRHAREC